MILSEEAYQIFRAVVYLVGIPIILLLCLSIFRRLRAIRELDAQVRQEEAQTIRDPYAQMAKMYEERQAEETLRQAKRGKVR